MSDADIVKTWYAANFFNSQSGIMYSANSSKKGLHITQLGEGSNDILLFNVKNIGRGFSLSSIILNLILVRINPNVPRMMLAQPLQEEPMWVDYTFMYGEESITSADFKTDEDIMKENIELIKKLEKEEREDTNSDDYKAEIEIIEKTN